MANWTNISALATGAGTLVLAIATFASVRTANRTARAAERSLKAGIRPILITTRPDDPVLKVGFADEHWIRLEGGQAAAEATGDAIYLAIGVKNAGNGMAVLDRWDVQTGAASRTADPRDLSVFHRLTRDIYIPANEFSFYQGAIREHDDPLWKEISDAINNRQLLTVDVLYADLEGGQRTITRFAILPRHDNEGWIATVGRHWYVDEANPR